MAVMQRRRAGVSCLRRRRQMYDWSTTNGWMDGGMLERQQLQQQQQQQQHPRRCRRVNGARAATLIDASWPILASHCSATKQATQSVCKQAHGEPEPVCVSQRSHGLRRNSAPVPHNKQDIRKFDNIGAITAQRVYCTDSRIFTSSVLGSVKEATATQDDCALYVTGCLRMWNSNENKTKTRMRFSLGKCSHRQDCPILPKTKSHASFSFVSLVVHV